MNLDAPLRWSLIGLLALGILVAAAFQERFDAEGLERWVQGAGAAAPLLFVLIYALATVVFLPGSVLTLAGGALFGPAWGTFLGLTGATIGALLAFLVARYLASDWAQRKAAGRLRQLKEGVEHEGWRFVAFVRLVPLFPFNLLNYALGLTRIRLSHYLIATYVCMLPGALAYSYLGYAGREALGGGGGLIQKGSLALGLLALALFLPRLIGRLRRASPLSIETLKSRLDAGEELLLLDVRPAADYAGEQGHIAGACNIPLEELQAHIRQLHPWSRWPVVLVCRTDRRSSQAAQRLGDSGFADVHVVAGGMTAWRQAGWPVVTGEDGRQPGAPAAPRP